MKQLMDLFGDVEPFLQAVTDSPATLEKLLSALRSTKEKKLLQVEPRTQAFQYFSMLHEKNQEGLVDLFT